MFSFGLYAHIFYISFIPHLSAYSLKLFGNVILYGNCFLSKTLLVTLFLLEYKYKQITLAIAYLLFWGRKRLLYHIYVITILKIVNWLFHLMETQISLTMGNPSSITALPSDNKNNHLIVKLLFWVSIGDFAINHNIIWELKSDKYL